MEVVLLLSGNYRAKKELAQKILENGSFRIVHDRELARSLEQNGRGLDVIIKSQLQRGIPTIIYDNKSLKKVATKQKNVFHINILEDEASTKIELPELNFEMTDCSFDDFAKTFCDVLKSYNNLGKESVSSI